MTVSFDEYTKQAVGKFDPDYAAYLYAKQNHDQEVTKLQTRHPLVRLVYSRPWLIGVAALLVFLMGANYNNALPKYQTIQAAPSSGQPLIINNVVK